MFFLNTSILLKVFHTFRPWLASGAPDRCCCSPLGTILPPLPQNAPLGTSSVSLFGLLLLLLDIQWDHIFQILSITPIWHKKCYITSLVCLFGCQYYVSQTPLFLSVKLMLVSCQHVPILHYSHFGSSISFMQTWSSLLEPAVRMDRWRRPKTRGDSFCPSCQPKLGTRIQQSILGLQRGSLNLYSNAYVWWPSN